MIEKNLAQIGPSKISLQKDIPAKPKCGLPKVYEGSYQTK